MNMRILELCKEGKNIDDATLIESVVQKYRTLEHYAHVSDLDFTNASMICKKSINFLKEIAKKKVGSSQ